MSILAWSHSFSVNVEEIDNQHKKLVDLINMLYDANKEGKAEDILLDILEELTSYAAEHFQTEEKYFDQFNYPNIIEHKKEHNAFIAQVFKFKNDIMAGRISISMNIMRFLVDWLTNHIKGSDKAYSAFFNEHGLK
jgi:hemerythrin